jgi:hypothetical protein
MTERKQCKCPTQAKIGLEWATVGGNGRLNAVSFPRRLCVHPEPEMLQQASFNAAKTCGYKLFTPNGQPVKVQTLVNVDLHFGR